MNNPIIMAVIEEFLSVDYQDIQVSIVGLASKNRYVPLRRKKATPAVGFGYECTIIKGGEDEGEIVTSTQETPMLALYRAIVELAKIGGC